MLCLPSNRMSQELITGIDAEGGRAGSLGLLAPGGDTRMASIALCIIVRAFQTQLLPPFCCRSVPAEVYAES